MGRVFKVVAIICGGLAAASVVIMLCDRLGWQTQRVAAFYQILHATEARIGTKLFRDY